MNSTEEITKYRDPTPQYYSPTFSRRIQGCSYDFPEKSQKKDKKWSISSLFRRKKKEGSESSSEEDKKGFLTRRKKKPEKRRKSIKPVGTFDHVVITPPGQRHSFYTNGHEDAGILSDPTCGFPNYFNRALPRIPTQNIEQPSSLHSVKTNKESSDDVNHSRISVTSGSADGSSRKSRKEIAKARAEARRTTLRHDSSSDEDSQRSASSCKFRSDESLSKCSRDIYMNRKSRSARTERYFRRHSKDGENPKDYLRLSKSDAESSLMNWKLSDESNRSPSRSPLVPSCRSPLVPQESTNRQMTYSNSISSQSNLSGVSTIPPSHGNLYKFRVSNSTNNPSYKPPLSLNDYNNRRYLDNNSPKMSSDLQLNNHRSISCDADIHKAPSAEMVPEVMHVRLPISRPNPRFRNLSLIDPSQYQGYLRQPPPPPPRDPKRLVTVAQVNETGRPNSYFFDTNGQSKSKSFSTNYTPNHVVEPRKFSSFNLNPNFRSTSDDHLPKECSIQLVQRPSSATPESSASHKVINRNVDFISKPENYHYLTDKKPRSRKPIFIQQSNRDDKNENNNDPNPTKKVLDFWKQKDKEDIRNVELRSNLRKTKSPSPTPQMFTCQTHVETQLFLPSVIQTDVKPVNNSVDNNENISSSVKNGIDSVNNNVENYLEKKNEDATSDTEELFKRKSSNLEEALNELEAIYNSLKLGDEDLLERAEEREKEAAAQKLLESTDPYVNFGVTRGSLSDSSFSYEPFDSLDSPRRRRLARKSAIDRKLDDMAYRKINKEKASTIADPQSALSKVSYLLASPVYNSDVSSDSEKKSKDEPDITLDDVLYRTVKHANNTLKVVEPQPPFGIPLGPIAPSSNSDYLHAVPEDTNYNPSYKRKKIPDIVKDDLAYRNLRKDPSKEPVLPPLSPDDFTNNNSRLESTKLDISNLKKRRAVRSLSANIGSLFPDDLVSFGTEDDQNSNRDSEFKNLTDIADAMEIARQVLKEKESRISATRRAFLSDSDSNTRNINYPLSNTDAMTENRIGILNELKSRAMMEREQRRKSPRLGDDLNGRPPRGSTPDRKLSRSPHKESTPIPLSPLDDRNVINNNSQMSSFEDLLTAMAVEAKETTERITRELRQMAEEKEKRDRDKEAEEKQLAKQEVEEKLKIGKNTSAEHKPNICSVEEGNSSSLKKSNLAEKLSDIDAVSEHAKLCEKLLECVVDSTELMVSSKSPTQQTEEVEIDPVLAESVAEIEMCRETQKSAESAPKAEMERFSESDHDYENITSDKEMNVDEIPFIEETIRTETKCRSPFEERKAELIATFQELGKEITDIPMPRKVDRRSEEAEKVEEKEDVDRKPHDSVYDNVDNPFDSTRLQEAVTGKL